MPAQGSARRRPYGSGSLFQSRGSWYGKWRVGDRQVKRRIGPVRKPSTRDGLTRKQAEAALRRIMDELRVPPPDERLTVEEAGRRYLLHLEHVMERKPTTIQDYRIMLDRHLAPFFGDKRLDRIRPQDVTSYITAKSKERARQSVVNQVNFLHGIFAFALKRGWSPSNPVLAVDRPRARGCDSDIRYLTADELDRLIAAVPDDLVGPTDRALYLAAAMTGLRQGELIALRWMDVDRLAGLIRVRRTYTRGRFGTPKSRRGSRAVPMADRVAAALEGHFGQSAYKGDNDLVFAHPETGQPYDASKMRKRFKKALKAAELRPLRFHDLRHTFGTRMAAAGAPLRTLQEWLGHRDYATTAIYADFAPDASNARAWAEKAFPATPSGGDRGVCRAPGPDGSVLREVEIGPDPG